ncbi:MAG: MerR family DNA-binding transcriptional regulator, partial [Turicibacter sp.]
MSYTIKQVSEKTNLSTHTIRFYEKEGLLPSVHRNELGNRSFTDTDLE